VDYSKFDDETLLRLIHRANADALGVFYDRYSRLVYSVAYSTLGDTHLAEDITQDVFMRIWQRAGTYNADQSRVTTWLTSITRHRIIDVLRQQRIRPEKNSISWAETELHDPPDEQNVESDVDEAIRRRQIRWAINQLPEEQQMALGLSFFRGMSHPEIAEALGEPLGTVKTRIRLGMQKLRQLLKES